MSGRPKIRTSIVCEDNMERRKRYVSASEIGSVHFCARSYYYNVNRAPSSYINKSQRLRGDMAHSELSKKVQGRDKKHSLFKAFLRWLIGWFK